MQICYVDIIDKCNLRCPTCVRGTQLLKNSADSMSIDSFKNIVAKAKSEGYDTIGIYNWIEPFLVKNLKDFIAVVKNQNLECELSSNLSLKPTSYFDIIQQYLLAGLNRLTVSVSGYNQQTYQINHVGGNIAWIKENLERIALLKKEKKISTHVFLRFIKFDYNVDEEEALRQYAASLKLEFEIIDGVGHPNQPVNRYASEDFYTDQLKNFTGLRNYEKNGEICPLIMDTIAIDSQGDAYICCAYPYYPNLRIGSYLELSKQELLLKRYMHPICPSCSFTRREATSADRDRLVDALDARLGVTRPPAHSSEKALALEWPQQLSPWTRKLYRAYQGMMDKFKARSSQEIGR